MTDLIAADSSCFREEVFSADMGSLWGFSSVSTGLTLFLPVFLGFFNFSLKYAGVLLQWKKNYELTQKRWKLN
jgi:hypothetical protein